MRYCNLPNDYEHMARHDKTDKQLMEFLDLYSFPGGNIRKMLTGENREDHRAFRREVVREALRRGLIDKDPGDAP